MNAGEQQLPLKDLSILVVEDEPIIFCLLEDMLHTLGCTQVWHAATVESALALLDETQPDAAVLDVNLGRELTYAVAEQLDASAIPFVFATGQSRNSVAPAWKAHTILQKPFDTKVLGRELCKMLQKQFVN